MASDPPEREPSILGDFRILRRIGSGGQGSVFVAEQRSLKGRLCAVKTLARTDLPSDVAAEAFRREAEIAASLDYPNIVPIFAFGQEGDLYYFAMKYIEGADLADVIDALRSGEFDHRQEDVAKLAAVMSFIRGSPVAESGEDSENLAPKVTEQIRSHVATLPYYRHVALSLASVADALEHAHGRGVVHRDIKPRNIVIDRQGTPLIADFGLAIELGGRTVAWTGEAGTPGYMSPEQITSSRIGIDKRTDIYSLGVTLYELVTLRRPFLETSQQVLFRQILMKAPVEPRRVDPHVPADLGSIALHALQKDPDRRYQTAAAMAADLRAFSRGWPVGARAPGPVLRWLRSVRRIGTYLVVAAASVALFALVQHLTASEGHRPIWIAPFVLRSSQNSFGWPDELLRATGEFLDDSIGACERKILQTGESRWLPIHDDSFPMFPRSPLQRHIVNLFEACREQGVTHILRNEFTLLLPKYTLTESSLAALKREAVPPEVLAAVSELRDTRFTRDKLVRELEDRLPQLRAWHEKVLRSCQPAFTAEVTISLESTSGGGASAQLTLGPFAFHHGDGLSRATLEESVEILRKFQTNLIHADESIEGALGKTLLAAFSSDRARKAAAAAHASQKLLAGAVSWEDEFHAFLDALGGDR